MLAPLFFLAGCSFVHPRPESPAQLLPWSFDRRGEEVERVPLSAVALGQFLKGELALRAGDRDVALQAYEKAVAADPRTTRLRQRLAERYVQARPLPEAHAQCVEVRRRQPENVDVRFSYAGILSSMGDTGNAVRECDSVLNLDPNARDA